MTNQNQHDSFRNFVSSQNFKIQNERNVQKGRQFVVTDGDHRVHCTLYSNGNVLVQGAKGGLKDIFLSWAEKSNIIPTGGGYAAFYLGWREWSENANWLEKYIKKNGYPTDNQAPHSYKIHREILFHDYMFKNKSYSEISYETISFVIENWVKRFCFMNLDHEALSNDINSDIKNSYLNDNPNATNFATAADVISQHLCSYCSKKFIKHGNNFICPQVKDEQNGCAYNIVDSLYPYSAAGNVLAYTKTNLTRIIKRKKDTKWYDLAPASPIESTMAEGLKSAGILNVPQFQAFDDHHKYKLDFCIKTSTGPRIGIECDGLQFHANAKTYIRDRVRDRYLQERGFYMMRFSSVEIFNNIDGCIEEIDRVFWKFQKGKLTLKDPPRTNYFGIDE